MTRKQPADTQMNTDKTKNICILQGVMRAKKAPVFIFGF